MRIACLSTFYPYRGGIAQFNASVFGELGRTHTVQAFNFKRQYPEFLFPGKTQFVDKNDVAAPVESVALLDSANPFTYISTAKAIAEWKPDVLLLRYWMSYFGPSLGFVGRRLKAKGCKVIAILDNVIPHEKRFFDKPFTKYFLSGVSGCISMCSEVDSDLQHLRSDLPHIILPHPLYDHFGPKLDRAEALKALGLPAGRKTLLFFGLIREYKGLDILLEAFRSLGDDYQLIVAGEPYGSFEPYQKIIDSLPGKDRIKLVTDYIGDSDVKAYFSAADLVVLPYRSATQSGISAIAYHFDTPLVVTNVGGLEETIGQRGTGLVAERPEPACIVAKVEEFFNSPETRERCLHGILREKERLSWTSFCKGLTDFAESI